MASPLTKLIAVALLSIFTAPHPARADIGTEAGTTQDFEVQNVCGQLALSAVAEYLGRPDAVDAAFKALPADGRPRSLNDLLVTAQRLGFAASAVRWHGRRPFSFTCPAIVRLNPSDSGGIGHFIVVLKSAGDFVQVLDLPGPPRWISADKLCERWDGVAIHVANSEVDLPPRGGYAKTLLFYSVLTVVGLMGFFTTLRELNRGKASPGPVDGLSSEGSQAWPVKAAVFASLGLALIAGVSLATRGQGPGVVPPRPLLEAFPAFQRVTAAAAGHSAEVPARAILTYRVYNHGRRPVRIGRISTSCACASGKLSANTIPPYGHVEVKVEVQPKKGQRRPFMVNVAVVEPVNYLLELGGEVIAD